MMAHSPAQVTARVALAVIGGYAVTSGIVAVLSVALPAFAGMIRSEAVVLSSMLGFIVYLVILLWGFSHPRLGWLALYFSGMILLSVALIAAISRFGLK